MRSAASCDRCRGPTAGAVAGSAAQPAVLATAAPAGAAARPGADRAGGDWADDAGVTAPAEPGSAGRPPPAPHAVRHARAAVAHRIRLIHLSPDFPATSGHYVPSPGE
ncbi:exported hypothetical protein [Parafrankia sp. Ea1.12]|nr:exported hypothetical protein [Parafrankia sp. Ea1.12]